MDEDWQLRWVRVPEGTHLSDSKGSAGAERDLLREDRTNKLLGPTESVPADIDEIRGARGHEPESPRRARELSPAQRARADTIVDLLEIVIDDVVVPVVREVVVPAIRRKLSEVTKNLRSSTKPSRGQVAPAQHDGLPERPRAEPSADIDVVVAKPTIAVSGAEFRARLLEALAAERYAAAQRRMLASARIEDHDVSPELERAIKLVLEGNTEAVDEATLAEVAVFLRGPRFATDQRELTRNDDGRNTS
jgi:hypothetical protein